MDPNPTDAASSAATPKALADRERAARALAARARAIGLAERAMPIGDLATLELARAAGWNPSLGSGKRFEEVLAGRARASESGVRPWVEQAMREASGRSMEWLCERFPVDVAEAFLSGALKVSSSGWSAKAMLAAEAFGLSSEERASWIDRCGASARAADYFAASFARDPGFWFPPSDSPSAASQAWAAARPFLGLLGRARTVGQDKRLDELLLPRIEEIARRCLAYGGEPSSTVEADLFDCAIERLGRKAQLAGLGPLLDLLPERATRMGGRGWTLEEKGEASRSRGSRTIDQISELSNPGRSRGALGRVGGPFWELGALALVGEGMENFELAMSRGWIGPLPALGLAKVEHPDFVAWSQAKAQEAAGRPLDMEARWRRCAEAIGSAAMPESMRADLLERARLRDAKRWREGAPKLLELRLARPASPTALLLACESRGRSKEAQERLEAKAEALSAAGWRLKDALADAEPLCALARKLAVEPWAKRLVEREELAEACAGAAAPSAPRRVRL